jgi:hypothetical protein
MQSSLASIRARRGVFTALSVLALCGALSACGSSSSSSTRTTGGSSANSTARYQARLNLAKCFRAHGINVPDPTSGGAVPEGALRDLRSYPQSQVQAATQACRQYIAQAFPQLNLTPAQRAQIQRQLVKFAECMRSHGVDIPDPTFNGTGFGFRGAFGSVDRNSPAFQSALTACRSLRPRFGGRGGGASAGGAPGA